MRVADTEEAMIAEAIRTIRGLAIIDVAPLALSQVHTKRASRPSPQRKWSPLGRRVRDSFDFLDSDAKSRSGRREEP